MGRGYSSGERPERGCAVRRLGCACACKTCALLALCARAQGVRQNANACQGALLPTGLYRDDLVAKAKLRDKLIEPDELTSNVKQKNHAKRVHALQLFDKMLGASRRFC